MNKEHSDPYKDLRTYKLISKKLLPRRSNEKKVKSKVAMAKKSQLNKYKNRQKVQSHPKKPSTKAVSMEDSSPILKEKDVYFSSE